MMRGFQGGGWDGEMGGRMGGWERKKNRGKIVAGADEHVFTKINNRKTFCSYRSDVPTIPLHRSNRLFHTSYIRTRGGVAGGGGI